MQQKKDETIMPNAGKYFGPEAVVNVEAQTTLCLDCTGKHKAEDEVNMDYVEVDCPWHCDSCGALLGGNLTEDGVTYVLDAIIANRENGDGDEAVVNLWREHFSERLRDRLEECPHCGEDGLYRIDPPVEKNAFTCTHRCLDCVNVAVPVGDETPLMRAVEYAFDHEDDEAGCAIKELIAQVAELSKPTRLVITDNHEADYDEFQIWTEDGRQVKAVILDLSDDEEAEDFAEYRLPEGTDYDGETVACWASRPVEAQTDARFVGEVFSIRDDKEV